MISTGAKDNAIERRDQAFRYDSDALLELEAELAPEPLEAKQHRPKRSSSQKRRKAPKASNPGCGMAGRCNHRWSW